MNTSPISVIIPTFKRSQQILNTIEKICSCSPMPTEILVHIDYGDDETEAILNRIDREISILRSSATQGPGGGRNRLVQQASCDYIASFDDDSWPLDEQYFSVANNLLDAHPDVGVITGKVFHRKSTTSPVGNELYEVNSFHACGCIMRKEAILATRGYVPLRYAYGMEETDLSLQLLEQGWRMLLTSQLRVFHDTDMSHHSSRVVNSWHITNTALLAFLRYPKRFWFIGVAKTLNRVYYALSRHRYQGVVVVL